MSLVICFYCDRHVDSDDDPDVFQVDEAGRDQLVCESCREEAWSRASPES